MEHSGPAIPPITAAGTDPAYIPGLTPPPRPAAPVTEPPPRAAAAMAAPEELTEPAGPVTPEDPAASSPDSPDLPDSPDSPEDDGGPVFEVSDRRSAIIADHTGITLRLDGEEAEFGWPEIGAVEIDTPRFGRRFAITVYTTNRRWYEADVEAPSRRTLKSWTTDLDAVLDTRFPEAAPEDPQP